MMKNSLFFIMVVLLLLSQAIIANAENYTVNLTRKGSNIYKADGKDVIFQTRYCYVYAYSEEAIFKSSGYGGEVFFLSSKDNCGVKGVYGAAKWESGKYTVMVNHEADDWYEVLGTNLYIKTSMCLSLALGEDAFLTLESPGFGSLQFQDGSECSVEGIYTKLRL